MEKTSIYTKEGRIDVPLKQPRKENKEVPYWLQYFAALATAVSAIGIVIALYQLQVNSEQFSISNRGLLLYSMSGQGKMDVSHQHGAGIDKIDFIGKLENIGKTPIKVYLEYFSVYASDSLIVTSPGFAGAPILYPTEKIDMFPVSAQMCPKGVENHFPLLESINQRDINVRYKITYHDIGADHRKSTIERRFKVAFDQDKTLHMTLVAYNDIFN